MNTEQTVSDWNRQIKHRQTDRQTDRPAGRQAGRQASRQTQATAQHKLMDVAEHTLLLLRGVSW